MARGAAGLIRDLKQRGLLEDTIIHWTTEFGRMPSTQGSKGVTTIRMYSPTGFVVAVSRGVTAGQSDEWGHKPQDRANLKSTTSTPPCCTCSASTTNNSPSATTASTAD